VQDCAWRLQTDDDILAASEDSRSQFIPAVKVMEHQPVQGIDVTLPSLDTTIRFENGLRLRLFPRTTSGRFHESWLFFTPGHMALAIGPGSYWDYRRSDEP
jgi:hypothetical protein